MRKLNVHSLCISLDRLCERLEKDYAINHGGCCYVSYLIARKLTFLGINYKLVIMDKSIDSSDFDRIIRRNKPYVLTQISKENTRCHYCLLVNNTLINRGDFDDIPYCSLSNISYKEIYKIYRDGWWNSLYDRLNNDFVKKEINRFFRHYVK